MSEWISVEERLPEKDDIYLVKAPGLWGNNCIRRNIGYSTFKKNYQKHWGIERGTGYWAKIEGGRVTHWAYLPEEDDEND